MINKKAELTWDVVIRAVFVVLVLVIFVVLLVLGYKYFKKISEDSNEDLVIKECEIACLSGLSKVYCEDNRTVYSADESLAGERTCKYIESKLDDLECNDNRIKC